MCERASKQTPDLKILPRRDPPTPRFEIPGSATGVHIISNRREVNPEIFQRREFKEKRIQWGEVAFFSFWICFIYLRYKRVYIHTNIKHIYKMNNYFSSFSQKNGQYRVCWSKVCRYTGNCVQRKYCYFGQIKLEWALADLKGEGVFMGLQPPLNYFLFKKV